MADISDLVRRMLALRKVSSSDAEVFERMGPMDPEDYSILQSVLSIAPHSFKHPLTGTSYLSGATTEALAAVEGVQDSRRALKRKWTDAATSVGLGVEEPCSLCKEVAEDLQRSVEKLAEAEKDAVALQKLQAEYAVSSEELAAVRSEAVEMRQALQKLQAEYAVSAEELAAVRSEALETRQALQKLQAISAERLAAAEEDLMAARSEVVKMHQALQEREEGLRTLQEELRDAATRSQEREGRMLKELTAMGEPLQELEKLRKELNVERMRKITFKLGVGSTQSPDVRMLDFAIRAACLATTTEHVLEGRLLYRPDFCLITFARELSLLRSIDVATLDKWSLWDWNVKRVTHLCGAELVKDGVVDAKGVFTSMIKGMLRGKDQLCLSKEEITSMRLQLEDLENLQDLARGSLASPCYAEYREWQMRALEEYFLWVTERGRTKKNNCVPSSAAAQRDAMEWYKTCSEAYAVSVTLALRDRQEVPNNYWVPMAAAVYSKVRPRPVIL